MAGFALAGICLIRSLLDAVRMHALESVSQLKLFHDGAEPVVMLLASFP